LIFLDKENEIAMNMTLIDWLVVGIPFVIIAIATLSTRKYAKSVADFMAASRCGGRYLICNSRGEAGFGAISAIAIFEMMYQSGFAVGWWSNLGAPVGLLVVLTGFVIYRYRETRAMTLAQFFEMRYSKAFRIFAGFIAFLSGVVNYGIFPGVSAQFMVYFCGFPDTIPFHGLQIPTYAIIMVVGLSVALYMSLSGGQLTIMVNDCLLGLLSGLFYLIVACTLLYLFSWKEISFALSNQPAGHSLLNPFDSGSIKGFNIWYILIGLFVGIYGTMAWQGGHAFNSSAANPHEAKMGGILGTWRGFSLSVMMTLLGICAYTYLNHPDFAAGAAEVKKMVGNLPGDQIKSQMQSPMALAHFLPVGIKGVFCAIMLFAWLACDGSYLHSWGSIFVQDVLVPMRKKPFKPETHLFLLRTAIFGVALWGFLFSIFFRQTEYILMFFSVTGAIYLGGAGAVIIGGLYWKKGTAGAAWTAMITGSFLAVTFVILKLEEVYPHLHLNQWSIGSEGPLNTFVAACGHNLARLLSLDGQVLGFIASLSAVSLYVVVSLLTCRKDFNMDQLLHRGKYAIVGEHTYETQDNRNFLQKFLGIDKEFTRSDKILSIGVFSWSMFWFFVFVIGTLWNLIRPWPTSWWSNYWHFQGVILPLIIGIITTVWFTWGGIRDLRRLFHSLKTVKRDALDNGSVVRSPNQDGIIAAPARPCTEKETA
jgi:SSS family solute:Na+ symporter